MAFSYTLMQMQQCEAPRAGKIFNKVKSITHLRMGWEQTFAFALPGGGGKEGRRQIQRSKTIWREKGGGGLLGSGQARRHTPTLVMSTVERGTQAEAKRVVWCPGTQLDDYDEAVILQSMWFADMAP